MTVCWQHQDQVDESMLSWIHRLMTRVRGCSSREIAVKTSQLGDPMMVYTTTPTSILTVHLLSLDDSWSLAVSLYSVDGSKHDLHQVETLVR